MPAYRVFLNNKLFQRLHPFIPLIITDEEGGGLYTLYKIMTKTILHLRVICDQENTSV